MRKTALDKLAALKTELLPHQQRVIDRLREQEGLLVAHGLGTGKTLASIGASDSLGGRTEALVPASLQENYLKEIAKHTTGAPNTSVRSMQGEALRGEQRPTDLLVVDEAHRARETSTKLYDILKDYPAAKRMLLSATPVYNRPSDIAPLVNIAAGRKALPTGSAFKDRYVGKTSPGFLARMIYGETPEPILKNKKELGKILNKWVDYEPPSEKDFPKRINENIDVEMTPQQTDIHDMALGNLPWTQQRRINKGLPLEKKYLKDLNAFQSQTRQIGGSSKRFAIEKAELTPKLKRALEDLKSKLESNDQHRAVVYSNYLDVLGDYGEALKSEGVPSATYSGKLPQKQRKAMVDDYNAGKLKALLVSSAGGEGLDLKGTRQLQVLEPHWNDAKLEQVIGRAIRRGSHSHLPEDQRTVAVQRYLSRPRPGFVDRVLGNKPAGIEQVLSDMSLNKNQLNDQVMQLLKQPPLELEMQKTASQIADSVLSKLAEITDEEIARGLSGTPGRAGITPEEIRQRGQAGYDSSYASGAPAPWVGGGFGAGLGALGGLAGGGGKGAILGTLLGGAGGAGLGQLLRMGSAGGERMTQEALGDIAKSGRIPYSTLSSILNRLPEYAVGQQEDRIDPVAIEKFVEDSRREQRQIAIERALQGALLGNVLGEQRGDKSEVRDTVTGGASGALRGLNEGRRMSNKQIDLHERGYGHLANALQRGRR